MSTSDKDALLSMGFDPARVEWALKATGNRGLQPAMDHIFEHDGQPIPDLTQSGAGAFATGTSSGAGAMDVDDDEDSEALRSALKLSKGEGSGAAEESGGVEAHANSIKCSECGKIFRSTNEANFHAVKSGHDQFEESTEEKKPLTEEEKQQKLADLRDKMAQKRMAKAVQEAAEAKANEAIRRKAGKDIGQAQEDLKAKQLQKEVEQKKREKAEDARARAAVKAQIEADKRERAEKAAREKALREGKSLPESSTASGPAPSAPVAAAPSGVSGRDFKETRLQIRLASGGPPMTTTLSSDAPLREVAEFVASQNITFDVETVSFTQQFPRKTFSNADFSKTLRELGLTPSAVLIAS